MHCHNGIGSLTISYYLIQVQSRILNAFVSVWFVYVTANSEQGLVFVSICLTRIESWTYCSPTSAVFQFPESISGDLLLEGQKGLFIERVTAWLICERITCDKRATLTATRNSICKHSKQYLSLSSNIWQYLTISSNILQYLRISSKYLATSLTISSAI